MTSSEIFMHQIFDSLPCIIHGNIHLAINPAGTHLFACRVNNIFKLPLYTEKNSRIGFGRCRLYLKIRILTRALPIGQWSLAPNANFEKPPCPIPDS